MAWVLIRVSLADPDRLSQPVETFSGPRPVDLRQPRYPEEQIHRRQEGWVHLNFMVDTAGKPYEIVVVDAVGDHEFQTAAIRALKHSEFQPARLDGKAIESGANYAYQFELGRGGQRASRRFGRQYGRLLEALAAGDRAAADEHLQEMAPDNLYERAFLALGRYNYFRRWGSEQEQLRALGHAVGRKEDKPYLPDDVFLQGLLQMFSLQVRMGDFAGALETAGRLDEVPVDEPVRAEVVTAVEKILALRDDDRPYAVDAAIGPSSTSWFIGLYRDRFRLDQVDGRVAELKLRCAGRFVGFVFDPALWYTISERYLPCSLEVVGDPDTRFRLIQS